MIKQDCFHLIRLYVNWYLSIRTLTPISRIIHDRYICIFERDIKVNIFVQKKHHYTNIPHAFLTTLYDNCSVFVMSEISLLPHSSAQTEGEDDGQQLSHPDRLQQPPGSHHHRDISVTLDRDCSVVYSILYIIQYTV